MAVASDDHPMVIGEVRPVTINKPLTTYIGVRHTSTTAGAQVEGKDVPCGVAPGADRMTRWSEAVVLGLATGPPTAA